MISTPSKNETSFSSLTPVRFLDSPRAKLQGEQLAGKTRLDDITKNLLDNYAKWQTAQKRGQSLCNSIEAIKARCLESTTPGGTLFPEELKPYCDKLAIILTVFEDIVKATQESVRQLSALVRLVGKTEGAIYRSWQAEDFLEFARTVLERYRSELVVKQFVTEEMAHCEERSDLVRISSLWEYPHHVDDCVRVMFLYLAEEIRVK